MFVRVRYPRTMIFRVGICVGIKLNCFLLSFLNHEVKFYVRVRPSHHRNINRRRRTSFLCLKSALRKAFRDSPFNRSQSESTCKHPGKPDHSHLEIFRHTEYILGGDRHTQNPIHRTPDHRRSEVRRSRTHRQRCVPRSRDF